MNTRASDSQVKITREIPLSWVLSLIAAIAGQAAIVYFTQQEQGRLLTQQSETIKSLTAELRAFNNELNAGRLKDAEHDLRISDHERRISLIEGRSK